MAPKIRRWVIDGPAGTVEPFAGPANRTHDELAHHFKKTHGITASRSAMQRFCRQHGIRPCRATYRHLHGAPVEQALAAEDLPELRAKAKAGELVLLRQDEARFPIRD